MVGMGQDFKALDTQQVLLAYRRASRRAILLDWGGTLTPADSGFYDQREDGGFVVPEKTLEMLQAARPTSPDLARSRPIAPDRARPRPTAPDRARSRLISRCCRLSAPSRRTT